MPVLAYISLPDARRGHGMLALENLSGSEEIGSDFDSNCTVVCPITYPRRASGSHGRDRRGASYTIESGVTNCAHHA